MYNSDIKLKPRMLIFHHHYTTEEYYWTLGSRVVVIVNGADIGCFELFFIAFESNAVRQENYWGCGPLCSHGIYAYVFGCSLSTIE